MTAVRLTLIYILLFGLFSAGLIYYVSGNTVRLLHRQTVQTINDEVGELSIVFRRGNLGRLVRAIELRSRAPGSGIYLIADPSGRIIAGNVQDIERSILEKAGWRDKPFEYERLGQSGNTRHHAIAQVFIMRGGMRVLVGRDLGQPERLQSVIRRAMVTALVGMLLFGLAAWFFIGRTALQRIDKVSAATSRILDGDLDERLPLSGAGDEFDRLAANLNTLLERIGKLDEGLKQVSDNIAHDLKTPLTRLQNKAEGVLASDPRKSDYRTAVEQMLAETDGLIRTFNALLMISRVEAGSRTGDFTDVDLNSVLVDVCELYEPLAEEQGIVLEMEDTPTVKVFGNRELISQAIANLIDNAIKYAPLSEHSEPKIVVGLEVTRNAAETTISDNGPGIEEKERANVIERFVRLDKSRSKPGSGLGLSLVNAVAKLHKGSLEFANNNPGLIAKLTIPL